MVITAIPLVTFVTSEKEKEYYSENYGWVKQEACCLATGNDTALKDCTCWKPVFTLRKQVFWVVALYGWVIASQCFKGAYCLHFPDYESMHGLITQKMKAVYFFKTLRRNYPVTQCNNREDLIPQQPHGRNLKSLFSYYKESMCICFWLICHCHLVCFVDAWFIF